MATSPSLVFVHAFPMDPSMWAGQLATFPSALAPELPGFGGADGAGNVMTMEAAADRKSVV